MKVLISGVSGFVGKNLKRFLLKENHSIIGLGRKTESEDDLTWDDLPNKKSKAQIWVHLAGKAHDLKNQSLASEYTEVNLNLTKKLFNAFLQEEESKVFIYFSSVKAAASSVKGVLMEDDQLEIDNPYGKSKRAAEEFLNSQILPESKKVVILRPCMIHGPENKGNLNLLYGVVAKGIPYPLAAFENSRSFLTVANLCFAISEMVKKENFPGGTYQIADDEPLSTNDLIKIIAKACNKKPRLLKVPKPMMSILAKTGDLFKLPLNSQRLNKLTESYVVSNEKIKKALEIKRFPISAEDGLLETIKSFNK